MADIIALPEKPDADQQQQRVVTEVKRLARLSLVDWKYQLRHRAELFGLTATELGELVEAELKDRTKEARKLEQEDRRREQRAAKMQDKEERDQERKQKEIEKQTERKQKEIEKEAERKEKEKKQTFANIAKLPVARHEKELQKLAERLDEDTAALRKEFAEYLGVGGGEPTETTEPWPEPVNIADVLEELADKVERYVVVQAHAMTALVLWTAHTWLYDLEVPTHSPLLAATSAEPDSGKPRSWSSSAVPHPGSRSTSNLPGRACTAPSMRPSRCSGSTRPMTCLLASPT